ncbi:hypothetical protein U6G28_08955 [Actinomycetaceae bacterium MB13-C1-2]|nr:hypothetical protein U6G28_08955 [Actinomycetaceae bacterium MB13-C1-2]
MGEVLRFPKERVRHSLSWTRPLPALWDGMPITWEPFERDYGYVQLCSPVIGWNHPVVCPGCHQEWPPKWSARGLNSRNLWELWVERCEYCGHDQITEFNNNFTVWDLDESDYGPLGSNPPPENQPQEALF